MKKIAWASLVLMVVVGISYGLESFLLKIELAAKSGSIEVAKLVPIEDIADGVQLNLALRDKLIILGHQHDLARLPQRLGQTSGQNIALDLKRIGLLAIGGQHRQALCEAAYRHDRAIAFNDVGIYAAAINDLTFDVDRVIPNELVAGFYDKRANLDPWTIGQNQRFVRNVGLFSNRSPFLPSEETINDADRQQAERNQIRWRVEGFILGLFLFCGSFFLGAYSTQRFEQRRFRGLVNTKRDGWFWLSLLSSFGLFCGGFLMLIWPRLV